MIDRTRCTTLSLCFVLLIGCSSASPGFTPQTACQKDVSGAVPSLVGLSAAEASERLNQVCPAPRVFTVTPDRIWEGAFFSGVISHQFPPQGSLLQTGQCIFLGDSSTGSDVKDLIESGFSWNGDSFRSLSCPDRSSRVTHVVMPRQILRDLQNLVLASQVPDFPSSWDYPTLADLKYPNDSMILRLESDVINPASPSYYCVKVDFAQGGFGTHDIGNDRWDGCTREPIVTGSVIGPIFIWIRMDCSKSYDHVARECDNFLRDIASGNKDLGQVLYRADFRWAEDFITDWRDRPCSELWDKPASTYC